MCELGRYGVCKLEVKHSGGSECVRISTHVGRSQIVTEELEWAGVIDAVLWDQLHKAVTSCEAPPGVCLTECEIPVCPKVS